MVAEGRRERSSCASVCAGGINLLKSMGRPLIKLVRPSPIVATPTKKKEDCKIAKINNLYRLKC